MRQHVSGVLVAFLALAAAEGLAQPVWTQLGMPTGGDVRSLAPDPRRPESLHLGTAHGVLYRSDDAGRSWQRQVPGFPVRGASLDDLILDVRGRLFVGYWEVQGSGGGVARSDDGGRTFTLLPGLAGKAVRGLAQAPSNPDVLVAGTLVGVFRSDDAGASWRRISPEGHPDLKNVGSVAFDPRDDRVVYAGTWHLPWKTSDAGRTWQPIRSGMLDDSDVMTLTVDRRSPGVVYATACSGIYRSLDAAQRWAKIRGIPGSSRRTRAFAQDPERPQQFFAGTTEGLWRSQDDLSSWQLLTSKDLVVNAIAALPGGTLLVGTDGAGVLRSEDQGTTWSASNQGFAERFVSQVLFDGPRVVVGLLGDRHHSGVLAAPALSGPFRPIGQGLEGREVVSLALVPAAAQPGAARPPADVLAGSDDGVFLSASHSGTWRRLQTVVGGFDPHPRVAAVAAVSERVFLAATPDGLLRSTDAGESWTRKELGAARAVTALATSPGAQLVLAATGLSIFRSDDSGQTFAELTPLPLDVPLTSLQFLPGQDQVLVGTSTRGLLVSANQGRSWARRGGGLPLSNISSVALLPDGRTLFAADFGHGGLYVSRDAGQSWQRFTADGLSSERVWALAADPATPSRVVAAPTSGGLHVLLRP